MSSSAILCFVPKAFKINRDMFLKYKEDKHSKEYLGYLSDNHNNIILSAYVIIGILNLAVKKMMDNIILYDTFPEQQIIGHIFKNEGLVLTDGAEDTWRDKYWIELRGDSGHDLLINIYPAIVRIMSTDAFHNFRRYL